MAICSKKHTADSESTISMRMEKVLEVVGFKSVDTARIKAKAENSIDSKKCGLFLLGIHSGRRKKFGAGMPDFDKKKKSLRVIFTHQEISNNKIAANDLLKQNTKIVDSSNFNFVISLRSDAMITTQPS
jgi:hypothetical protein